MDTMIYANNNISDSILNSAYALLKDLSIDKLNVTIKVSTFNENSLHYGSSQTLKTNRLYKVTLNSHYSEKSMIHVLAHELRHVYQSINSLYTEDTFDNLSFEDYENLPCEVDARKYSDSKKVSKVIRRSIK